MLKRAAGAALDHAVAEALAAERSPVDLERRIDDRLRRILEAARLTRHYASSVPEVASDARMNWAQLPVLRREDVRSRPTAFLTATPESCFVRTTTGSSGAHGYVVKPRSSLAERAAVERRWFDSLSLPASFVLTMVTTWRGLRPFSVRFNDRRVRYRAVSVDRAREAMSTGRRIGDLVVTTPRLARSLRTVDATGCQYTSSFEFSRPVRALFGIERSGDAECSSESYVAGELSAPVAFRFPDCAALHVNADAVLVEVTDVTTGRPVDDGVSGRIVVSDLLNTAMPLLRYELGDFGAMTGRGRCRCGRVTPRLRLLARALSRLDRQGHDLARATAASDPSRLLVKVGPADYLLFAADGVADLDGVEAAGNVHVRLVRDVPVLVAPLLACATPLSIAERPVPA